MARKALIIGGTGTISTGVTQNLKDHPEWEVYLLNRGTHTEEVPETIHILKGDIRNEEETAKLLDGMSFDVVADFIGFTPEQVAADIRLFRGKTKQYIYISSVSVYQKPLSNAVVTESTSLYNQYWQYSRDKIACEELLMEEYRKTGFPITIVRPSSTYGDKSPLVGICGSKGCWQVLERMRRGKPVIVHGDGTSLWTYTHNSDFAKGFVGLMGNPRAIGESVHITSDEVLTWNQIHEIVAEALGVKANLIHMSTDFITACAPERKEAMMGDIAHSVIVDNSKIKKLVPEFCATVRYDQGARKGVEYMLSHPETQIPDPEFDQWCDDMIAAYEAGIQAFQKQKNG